MNHFIGPVFIYFYSLETEISFLNTPANKNGPKIIKSLMIFIIRSSVVYKGALLIRSVEDKNNRAMQLFTK